MTAMLLVPFFIVLLVAVVVTVVLGGRRPDAQRDAAWLAGAWDVRPDDAATYTAYLVRVRAYRRRAALIGVLCVLGGGVAGGGVAAGGVAPAAGLVVIWAHLDRVLVFVTVLVVGTLAAEAFRLRLPWAATPRAVPSATPVRAHLPGAAHVTTARVVVAAAVFVGVVLAVTGHGSAALPTILWGAVLVALCAGMRAQIAHRVESGLCADDAAAAAHLRSAGARSLAWLELAVAALVAAWTAQNAIISAWIPAPWAPLIVAGGLGLLTVLLVKASPYPPRNFPWSAPVVPVVPADGLRSA